MIENNEPKTYYCKICEQSKDFMDMHTMGDGTCKLCWSKKENKSNAKRGGNRKGYRNETNNFKEQLEEI